MIKTLYNRYFQKSRSFLFPSLGYKKTLHPITNTYLSFENEVSINDNKLVCHFEMIDYKDFKNFENNFIYKHDLFERTISIPGLQDLYVFNLDHIKTDFEYFRLGKYSKFSDDTKESILEYYGKNTLEYPYIHSFLYPERYFNIYSKLLNIDYELLSSVGELCDPYNPDKETFIYSTNKLGIVELQT